MVFGSLTWRPCSIEARESLIHGYTQKPYARSILQIRGHGDKLSRVQRVAVIKNKEGDNHHAGITDDTTADRDNGEMLGCNRIDRALRSS